MIGNSVHSSMPWPARLRVALAAACFDPDMSPKIYALRLAWYCASMTRTEAIAVINAKLATLDDARVQAAAALIDDLAAGTGPVRSLTPRELALLAQSKADFAAGRSYSHDEITAMLDERLALRGVPKSTA